MTELRATIAVPSFDTRTLLELCLGSIRAHAGPPESYEVLVVDTGSTDGSVELARSLARPWGVRTLSLGRVGREGLVGADAHGAALDLAAAAARGRALVTLDSDAYARAPGFLDALLGPIESDSNVAACGAERQAKALARLRRIIRGLLPGGRSGKRRTGFGYIRPNRAAYRLATIRRHGLSFAPQGDAGAGEALATRLEELGYRTERLSPRRLDRIIGHIRHATMVQNPERFPGLRERTIRSGRRRIEAVLRTPEAAALLRLVRDATAEPPPAP